jgi:membrane protease YdiL (CAAX protease family)
MAHSASKTCPVSIKSFFVWTFFLSWLIWIPLALSYYGLGQLRVSEGLSSIVRLVGVLMPAAAAIALTAAAGGRAAVGQLLARLRIWQVGWGWWTAAVVVYPAVLLVSALLYNWLGGKPALAMLRVQPAALLVQILILAIASFGEELGWRGVALPALQRQYSPLKSSLILGLAWATWHIPFWVLLGNLEQFGAGYFGLNYLFIVPSTAYLTWIFNRTCSSLLLPVAFHLAFNILNVAIVPVTTTIGAYALFTVLQSLIVIAVSRRIHRPVLEISSWPS